VNGVWAGKAGAIGFAWANVFGIGGAVEFDEGVGVGEFLFVDGGAEVGEGVLLGPEETGNIFGIVKGGDGVAE
jgi:hypothetical protein